MKISNRTYRATALFMALLMLLTSVNVVVDVHYCKGQFQSLNFFGEAKSCHEKQAVFTCPHHAKIQQQEDNNCCDNETIVVKADIEKVFSASELADIQLFVFTFVQVFFVPNQLKRQAFVSSYYKPPLIAKDIPILVQSFLL